MPHIDYNGNAVTLICLAALLAIAVPGASEVMKVTSQGLLALSCWHIVRAKIKKSKPAEIFGYSALALCYLELAVLGTIELTETMVVSNFGSFETNLKFLA